MQWARFLTNDLSARSRKEKGWVFPNKRIEDNNMKITITFELDPNTTNFGRCEEPTTSLHEAICQAVHEANEDALDWLVNNVVDVSV